MIPKNACQKKEAVIILSGNFPDYKNETLKLIPVEEYLPSLEPSNKELLKTQTDCLGHFKFRSGKIKLGFSPVIQGTVRRRSGLTFRYASFLTILFPTLHKHKHW